jgi:hypothetical protein
MDVDQLSPDSPRWSQLLSTVRHDVYHLPSFMAFAGRRQEPGRPALFVAQEGRQSLLVPLIVREIPPSINGDGPARFDATCPRGYPGPLLALDDSGSAGTFADRAIEALAAYFRQCGIVAVFSRLHPLLTPTAAMQRAGTVVEHGDSWYVDLRSSDAVLWGQTRPNHRRDINEAARQGYLARIDEAWERFDEFVDAFQLSMVRLNATAHWHLSRDYFADLRDSLGEQLHLCVVERGEDFAAAGLLTEVDGIVEYHLSGTTAAHVSASPSKLVIDYARRWAKSRGNRVLHLAGSLRRGDSLSHFKAGFSPLHSEVCSWRLISDTTAYSELVDRWGGEHGVEADPPDGFFPAYRRPGPDDE